MHRFAQVTLQMYIQPVGDLLITGMFLESILHFVD